MTDKELKKIQDEVRSRIARTSFPRPVDGEDAYRHQEHAEYGASQH